MHLLKLSAPICVERRDVGVRVPFGQRAFSTLVTTEVAVWVGTKVAVPSLVQCDAYHSSALCRRVMMRAIEHGEMTRRAPTANFLVVGVVHQCARVPNGDSVRLANVGVNDGMISDG